ncbi:acyl-CoA carboxylase epsilon subunit [Myceligenerans pegani]|uniref:Acyl-CoA carboxylase epsilon subunit-like protein n=1 Tax=Myceligenerans pegani TaxID=2776917 RepID=A0ABR9N1Q0_9MICO|nr:acyl-CoA carboxylase epsilon subunit [Myceligenerans sp. TRM 65318]MBE1877146.1 hypothetical protein [Myceligenerans sp. TRM 65318]MBE3019417.1 hypothetical protein [Myceligenerans sp. TRM 65318]
MSSHPQVRVVRGRPDDVEVAALVAGLAAVTAAVEPEDAAPIDEWTNRSRVLRGNGAATAKNFGGRSGRHNADAWRWSLRS